MASLLQHPLFEISGQGPPPNKNYYHLTVTKSDVIWRWWKISLRAVDRYSRPGELKESHQDFLDDTGLQSEVSMVFGCQILQYTKGLCQGHYDYLERLSDSLLLQIINYLELEDVVQLGRTSRRFKKLCGSEMFWEQAVRRRCNTLSAEVVSLAAEVGWRNIFFTRKLQLQKLISRRRTKNDDPQEGRLSDPKTRNPPDESSDLDQSSSSKEESHRGSIVNQSLSAVTEFHCDVSPGSGFSSDSRAFVLEENCVVKAAARGDYNAKQDRMT